MGKDTVCTVEHIKALKKNKPVIEAVNKLFNLNENFENQIAVQDDKLFEIHNMLGELTK